MIESLGKLILILGETCIALLLLDGILWILSEMFSFSWKKVLMWAGAVFGILWLKNYLKDHKRNNADAKDARDENDNDFSQKIEENNQ